jgi:hypothetical protein
MDSDEVYISPNPVKGDALNLFLPQGFNQGQFYLYNLTGRLMQSNELSETDTQIQIGNLPSGMYLIVVDLDGDISTQRVVVK